MIDPGLREKVVLVTGANNPYGIGAAVAGAFAAQGARVFLHYFRQSHTSVPDAQSSGLTSLGESFYYSQQFKSADEVLERLRSLGVQAYALEADLSDPVVVPMLFDRAEATLGPVEVLVNNAAYWEGDTFLPSSTELNNKLVELWTDRPQRIAAASFRDSLPQEFFLGGGIGARGRLAARAAMYQQAVLAARGLNHAG